MLNKFIAIGITTVGLSAASAAAMADGMPRAGYRDHRGCANWSGVYIGGHVGGAWAKTDLTWVNNNWFNFGPGDRSSIEPDGFIAGGHAGVQHQFNCWVVGLEGSFAGGNISREVDSPFFPGEDTHAAYISRVTTVTGRLGYSWDNWLLYGKGGYAGALVELAAHTNNNSLDEHALSERWHNGWTVGAGLEYQLRGSGGKSIVFGLEYNYVDLGRKTHSFTCDVTPCNSGFPPPVVSTDADMHVVMGRVTFLLGRDDGRPMK